MKIINRLILIILATASLTFAADSQAIYQQMKTSADFFTYQDSDKKPVKNNAQKKLARSAPEENLENADFPDLEAKYFDEVKTKASGVEKMKRSR